MGGRWPSVPSMLKAPHFPVDGQHCIDQLPDAVRFAREVAHQLFFVTVRVGVGSDGMAGKVCRVERIEPVKLGLVPVHRDR